MQNNGIELSVAVAVLKGIERGAGGIDEIFKAIGGVVEAQIGKLSSSPEGRWWWMWTHRMQAGDGEAEQPVALSMPVGIDVVDEITCGDGVGL